MEETTFRILEALARNLGRPLSIKALTTEIQKRHKSTYYANVYHKVQALSKEGFLSVSPSGGASFVGLDVQAYPLIDLLAEMEIHRKRDAMLNSRIQTILASIDEALFTTRASAVAVDLERNMRLNRVELLVLCSASWIDVHEVLKKTGNLNNIRIDFLLLTEHELLERIGTIQRDPVKAMLHDGMAIIYPQLLWSTLVRGAQRGQRLAIEPGAKPAKTDLLYNLERFGYATVGKTYKGEPVCIEETAIGALVSKNARDRLAAAVLLGKNEVNPRLLAFLAVKSGVEERLLGLVEAMGKIATRPSNDEVRAILKTAGVNAMATDVKAVERAMEVYDAA